MLYISTRNKNDVFTAYHTMKKDRCENGGLYVPFSLNTFTEEEINSFKDKSFGQTIAEILNLFFSARIGGLDVDFCIGKNTAQLKQVNHRIVIAEAWHNSDWDFQQIVNRLSARFLEEHGDNSAPSGWMHIAVRISVLFAIYGELLRSGVVEPGKTFDISVNSDDFSIPMAAWYARKMGLPVNNIVCACNDNDSLWELIHIGQLHTDPSSSMGLERLIYSALGSEETEKFLAKCEASRVYEPDEEQFAVLRKGMFAAVVSNKRTEDVIRNVFRSSAYVLSPSSAAAYGGLQDYRANTGEGRTALIFSERSPVCACADVAKITGLSQQDIKEKYGSL